MTNIHMVSSPHEKGAASRNERKKHKYLKEESKKTLSY